MAYFRSAAVCIAILAVGCATPTNSGFDDTIVLDTTEAPKASVREEAYDSPFTVAPLLRDRVSFWKDIFTKYGKAQSVIHHRDFPQIVFGVIDLARERDAMSDTAFEAYKEAVVSRTIENVRQQLLELADGAAVKTPFQERMLDEVERRRLPVSSLRLWVEQDLIRAQTGIRERYAEAVRRAWRYLPVMEQIFVGEYGLPRELTRIPFIESSFDYTAYSSVGAAGIWQFMPKTARAHRMLVGRYVDERRDPLKATRAAAEYLRSAYNSLGSWPLAITSYNHGVGGVRAKVRKAGTENLARIIEDPAERYFGFASTNFYPEFLAAVDIFEDHKAYFPDVQEEPPLRVASYSVRRSVSAPSLASQLGMPVEHLREANYGLLDSVWSGRAAIPAGYTLRVPVEYRHAADRLFGVGTTEHVADVGFSQRGEGRQISRVSTSALDLPSVEIPTVDTVEIQQVARRSPARAPMAVGVTPSSSKARQKQVAVKTVTVRSGDTLASISKKYGVRVERIKQMNNLRSSKVTAGQKLLLPK